MATTFRRVVGGSRRGGRGGANRAADASAVATDSPTQTQSTSPGLPVRWIALGALIVVVVALYLWSHRG